jgi:EpsI family protein
MAKRTPNYLIVAILTIASACAGFYVVGQSPRVSFDANLEALPMKIGIWQGEPLELDEGTISALKADRVLSRKYVNSETGEPLGLLIIYRKYGRREFVHRPELCYPAAGWEIVQKSCTTVPYAGRNVRARLVIAQTETAREAITYIFASGDRTEANFVTQQLRMALDRLQKQKYGWAFIRLNVPELYGDDQAIALTQAFMKDAEKPLRKVLTEGE